MIYKFEIAMGKSSINLHKVDLKTLTIIQITIATIISLVFQFLIPFPWQPLDRFLYGIR